MRQVNKMTPIATHGPSEPASTFVYVLADRLFSEVLNGACVFVRASSQKTAAFQSVSIFIGSL